MSILFIILIIVLIYITINFFKQTENFDNNCVYKIRPKFTLNYSEFFETDEDGNVQIDDDTGYVKIIGDKQIDISKVIDNDLKYSVVEDLNEIIQNPFNPSYKLFDKENCFLNY